MNAVAAADVNGNPGLELVVARANELPIHTLDGALLWRSGARASPQPYTWVIGENDGLHVADVDGDGRSEIMVTDYNSFRAYEVQRSPEVSAPVDDVVVSEGDVATPARFTVRLSAPSSAPVEARYSTSSGTATAGSDFLPVSGVVTFDVGVTSQQIEVPFVRDRIHEGNETFTLGLSDPEHARLGDPVGNCVITNDDPVAVDMARCRCSCS